MSKPQAQARVETRKQSSRIVHINSSANAGAPQGVGNVGGPQVSASQALFPHQNAQIKIAILKVQHVSLACISRGGPKTMALYIEESMRKAISRYRGISQMKSTSFLCSLSIQCSVRVPQVQFSYSQYLERHNFCGTSRRPLNNLIRYLRPELNKVWEIFVHGLHPPEQETTSVPEQKEIL